MAAEVLGRRPQVGNLSGRDALSIGVSILIIVAVLMFLSVEQVQQFVGVHLTPRERLILVAGVALGAGTLTVLDDRVSTPVTSRNVLGVLLMFVGVYLLFGEALSPIGSAVVGVLMRTLTVKHVLAALAGILLIVGPGIIYWRRFR